MTTHFLVHDKADTVGVIVVDNVQPGQDLTGWAMDTDDTISIKSMDAIPLGHKIALTNIREGETLIKYGHDIGRSTANIGKGHHVHIHNARTKRW